MRPAAGSRPGPVRPLWRRCHDRFARYLAPRVSRRRATAPEGLATDVCQSVPGWARIVLLFPGGSLEMSLDAGVAGVPVARPSTALSAVPRGAPAQSPPYTQSPPHHPALLLRVPRTPVPRAAG